MSQSKSSSSAQGGSYVSAMDSKMPKFILRIELLQLEAEVEPQSIVKAQYSIFEESDNVLYKTSQLLREITAHVSDRNERAYNLDT